MVILPGKENLAQIDWTDSKQLFAFSVETVRIAGEYQAARKSFATTVAVLKTHLASAYKDGTIETKHSEEKAKNSCR